MEQSRLKEIKIQDFGLDGPITRGRAKRIKEQLKVQVAYLIDKSICAKEVSYDVNLLVINII